MPVHLNIWIYTFTFSDNPRHNRMIARVNIYVYPKYGENWTKNMGDMAKSLFLQFFLSLFLFFSLNPCISKPIRGTGLKFCTQVGFVDPTCSDL